MCVSFSAAVLFDIWFFIPVNIWQVMLEMHAATHVCKPAFQWVLK